MALYNGGAPTSQGENVDSCLLYKNGGVGLLGQMGDANAAVRAERWAWVVVTRGNNEVHTYVNGRLCAKINVAVTQPKQSKADGGDGDGGSSAKGGGGNDKGGDGADEGGGGGSGKSKGGKKEKLPERLRVDPLHLALFPPAASDSGGAGGDGADDGERGLSLRYIQLSTECWDASEVRKKLETLRAKDAEASLNSEAEAARSQQLSLQLLYAKPPPVWLHPALAAEFGDAFIAGTGLEGGSMHVSLEVVVLALEQMLREGGAAEAMLPHAERASLNSIRSALSEGRRLAHKLAHASSAEGQQRMYLTRVISGLTALEPGAALPVPCNVGGSATFVLVRRGSGADSDTCTVAVVGCEAELLNYGHRAEAAPPKIKYETCLELRGVKLSRLLDEALWVLVWFAGSPNDGKLSARKVFYQIVLSFLAESSLEQAIIKSDDLREEEGDAVQYRTPRRSKSAHYGSVRHALAYLLKSYGCSAASCKLVSLLLRAQMLAMAAHDLNFVRHVSTAERALLSLACRQLAYKAAKLGKPRTLATASEPTSGAPLLSAAHLANVRKSISSVQDKLKTVPGAETEATAPSPLILCEASAHLGRPSIVTLLGLDGGCGADGATAAELVPPVGSRGLQASRVPSAAAADGVSREEAVLVDVTDEAAEKPTSGQKKPTDGACGEEANEAKHIGVGRSPSVAAIEDAEVVGFYFSAGWCPACKTVTPLLASAYQSIRARGQKLEIVFISLDKSAAEFEQSERLEI